MSMTPLATAMAEAVSAAPLRRVPLATLIAAAAAVDRSGAVSLGWRSQIAAAIEELADAGIIELPRTRWDTSSEPPLPAYVTRPPATRPPTNASDTIVWHAELGWAAELDAANELSGADRRFLESVNAWLRRRGTTIAPQRERSLDICGNEKALDKVIFTPIFAPTRLTYEMLRCEPCWPPVHQEILGPGPWLIIENWTTFRSVARAARDRGWTGRLIWGAGNQVGTRLASLAAARERPIAGLCYFGDIDIAGFRIARMAAGRTESLGLGKLTAARALYQLCRDAGVPGAIARQKTGDLEQWTQEWLGGALGMEIARLISDGSRIVQETVGVELLSTVDTAPLFAF
jgi:hypothetical protein